MSGSGQGPSPGSTLKPRVDSCPLPDSVRTLPDQIQNVRINGFQFL
jgi:hypothetical protein